TTALAVRAGVRPLADRDTVITGLAPAVTAFSAPVFWSTCTSPGALGVHTRLVHAVTSPTTPSSNRASTVNFSPSAPTWTVRPAGVSQILLTLSWTCTRI